LQKIGNLKFRNVEFLHAKSQFYGFEIARFEYGKFLI
jgi:hypothetical protein